MTQRQQIIITINPRAKGVEQFVKVFELLTRRFTKNGVILSVETKDAK